MNQYEFERTILYELHREFANICWRHKVKLRPITLLLSDSKTKWGQFNPIERTISISRKLVLDHPWHIVVGILRHEMSHQYVDEQSSTQAESGVDSAFSPHGDLFQQACRRLGVSAPFARAGINLQNHNFDFHGERTNPELETILSRARKLLALGASSNEHEASLAMQKVRELYAKYNLEHAAKNSDFFHIFITHRKKRMEPWQRRTISILAEHFFVKVLIVRQYDVRALTTVHGLEIIGTKENALMAEFVYHFLLQQIEFLMPKSLEGRAQKTSFRLGTLEGFDQKLGQSEKKENPVVSKALIQFKQDSHLMDYMNQVYPRLSHHRGQGVRVDPSAFSTGQKIGQSLTLKKPITNSTGHSGLALGSKVLNTNVNKLGL